MSARRIAGRGSAVSRRGVLAGGLATVAAAALPPGAQALPAQSSAAKGKGSGGWRARGIIDVHSHPSMALYLDHFRTIDSLSADQAFAYRSFVPKTLPLWSAATAIAMMDREGIRAQVLSLPDATLELRGATARAFAREINENMAAIVAAHPGRFAALAVLPHDDVESTLAELAYALDVLKLDGVTTTTTIRGTYLGAPAHQPWLAELHRREAVLFAHPTYPRVTPPSPMFLEFCYETARMMTDMVLSGTKQRFHGIRLITAHGGGATSLLAHRLELLAPLLGPDAPSAAEIDAGLKSFYCDLTSCLANVPLAAAVDFFGAHRLMVGFDTPYVSSALVAPELARFDAFSGFDDTQRDAIAFGNALGLFPRLAAAH